MKHKILVTGASGYIGSHACVALLQEGFEVVALDNLANSLREAISRVEKITNCVLPFVEADVRNRDDLDKLFSKCSFDAVIHFAGLKAVGESVAKPLTYYQNNVGGTLTLLEAMFEAQIKCFIFSSSATVYAESETLPLTESSLLQPYNPYGRSKLMVEEILSDIKQSDTDWRSAVLRYFNPVGAHPSGLIGEDPKGIPQNLFPLITQVASGKRAHLSVFGSDYPTHDGTAIRDYIHVMDLARGHVAALMRLLTMPESFTVNLGTGQGYSVLDVVRAFEIANECRIPYQITARRQGDIAAYYADPTKAHSLLGWHANQSLMEMCVDHWRWQNMNHDGYK